MKTIPTTRDVLDVLFEYMIKEYDGSRIKEQQEILFELTHDGEKLLYTLVATPEKLELRYERVDTPALTVQCTAFDWIRIAGNDLNPIIAAMTGRVKFTGNPKILSAITTEQIGGKWEQIHDTPQDYEFSHKRHWTPPKKVLAISGSPRGDAGYTHAFLTAVLDGMQRQGVEIETIPLKSKNIRACTGCWSCWLRTEGECVFNDDMREVVLKLEQADVIVYAFPIYIDGVPGIVKNVLDRQTQMLYPYMIPGISKTRHPRRTLREQYCVVLSTSGFPEIETFTPMIHHFDAIAHNHHVPVLAYLLAPQGNNLFENPLYYPQLIEKVEALKQAGEHIIMKGKVDKKILRAISATTPRKKMRQWQTYASQFWQNNIDKKSTSY